jgi:Domain of unknown function (DUF4832)/Domain of unknown function (DUF4874)
MLVSSPKGLPQIRQSESDLNWACIFIMRYLKKIAEMGMASHMIRRSLLSTALLLFTLFTLSSVAEEIVYPQSSEVFLNPERGFYALTFLEDGYDYQSLRSSGISTVFAYIRLDDFRSAPISADFLLQISNAFDRLRAAGLKATVRIAYTRSFEDPDADSLERMATHLEQLEPIFATHSDVIAWFQAGMIGPWGEWHSSPHDTPEGRRFVMDELLAHTPPLSFIAVRTPMDKWEYLDSVTVDLPPLSVTLDSSSNPGITIDGDFSDWVGIPPSVSDPAGDHSEALADFTDVWVTNSATHLLLRIQSSIAYSFLGDGHAGIFFDLDNDPETGFPSGPVGSELLSQALSLYDERGGEFNEGPVTAAVLGAPSGAVMDVEIAIPLSITYPDASPVFPPMGSTITIDMYSDPLDYTGPGDRLSQSRVTPVVSEETAFTSAPEARIAHHNDCFLAPPTDLGTYPLAEVELWKDRVANDTLFVPLGGEVCGQDHAADSDCAYSIGEMEHLHWTYLGGLGNAPLTAPCSDEISRRLGYRIELIAATLPDEVQPGEPFSCEITLRNVGFAPLHNARPVFLRILANDAVLTDIEMTDADPRRWRPDELVVLSGTAIAPDPITADAVDLALWLPDRAENLRSRPEYSVRLANPGVWDAAAGHSVLATDIPVAGAPSGVMFSDISQSDETLAHLPSGG